MSTHSKFSKRDHACPRSGTLPEVFLVSRGCWECQIASSICGCPTRGAQTRRPDEAPVDVPKRRVASLDVLDQFVLDQFVGVQN